MRRFRRFKRRRFGYSKPFGNQFRRRRPFSKRRFESNDRRYRGSGFKTTRAIGKTGGLVSKVGIGMLKLGGKAFLKLLSFAMHQAKGYGRSKMG